MHVPFEILFVLMNSGDSELERYLLKLGFRVTRLQYRNGSDRISCFWQLYRYFLKEKPAIVHCHLVEGGLTGIPAAWLASVPKRIYTRHHSSYHHLYHPRFVKVDKMIDRLATDIIAISGNVKEVLMQMENVPERKIHVIHHGFRLEQLERTSPSESILAAYNPQRKSPVIGVISRYQHLKGHEYIIDAYKQLLIEYPNALLVLANARGEYAMQVKSMLKALPEKTFVEIDFEEDIAGLYSIFDVFIHAPINRNCEAFGQIYVEALAAGVPSVFSLSGIAPDFIVDHQNALVVPFCDADAIYKAVSEILSNSTLREHLIRHGRDDVYNKFGLHKMMTSLIRLYE